MTDEVNLDNLDALAELSRGCCAVEALPAADAAVDSINDNADDQPVAAEPPLLRHRRDRFRKSPTKPTNPSRPRRPMPAQGR